MIDAIPRSRVRGWDALFEFVRFPFRWFEHYGLSWRELFVAEQRVMVTRSELTRLRIEAQELAQRLHASQSIGPRVRQETSRAAFDIAERARRLEVV